MGGIWSHITNQKYDYGKSSNQNQQYKPLQELKREEIYALLKSVSVFSHLTTDEIKQLVSCMRYRTYKYGEKIVKQGDEGTEFYLICRGHVKVLINDVHNQNVYKQIQVATLKTGDTFGETSLITNKPRNATIKCIQDTKVLYCDKYTFLCVTNKNKNKIGSQQNIALIQNNNNINNGIIVDNNIEGKEEEKNNNIAADPQLLSRLNEYGLSRYASPLINKLGVECLTDLKYCSTQDFQSIGCKIVQIKKLQEIIQRYVNEKNNQPDLNRRNTSFI
eukprot:480610_1